MNVSLHPAAASMSGPFRAGTIAIVHLINPSEQLWGVLEDLSLHGVTLRALNLSSFEDWMAQAVRDEPQTLGLATLFVPLFRVEKIYLDEAVGVVASYQDRFQERVGMSVRQYLGLGRDGTSRDPDLEDDLPS